jgi:hypothetical protein
VHPFQRTPVELTKHSRPSTRQ